VLRRMLANEAKMDIDLWLRRIRRILRDEQTVEPDMNQNELFS
jgi:hypothetical protein